MEQSRGNPIFFIEVDKVGHRRLWNSKEKTVIVNCVSCEVPLSVPFTSQEEAQEKAASVMGQILCKKCQSKVAKEKAKRVSRVTDGILRRGWEGKGVPRGEIEDQFGPKLKI